MFSYTQIHVPTGGVDRTTWLKTSSIVYLHVLGDSQNVLLGPATASPRNSTESKNVQAQPQTY